MTQELLRRVENGIGYITFNRPDTRNGLVPEFLQDLIAVIKEFDESAAVRVLLVTGAGQDVSSGGDKKFLRDRGGKIG